MRRDHLDPNFVESNPRQFRVPWIDPEENDQEYDFACLVRQIQGPREIPLDPQSWRSAVR